MSTVDAGNRRVVLDFFVFSDILLAGGEEPRVHNHEGACFFACIISFDRLAEGGRTASVEN